MKKNLLVAAAVFFFSAGLLSSAEKNTISTDAPAGITKGAEAAGYLSGEMGRIENPVMPSSPGILGTTINLLVSLLLVIGLIYLVMAALKYFYVRASIPMKSEGVVKVLAREHIDSKKMMYVVEFGDRVVLIGSAGENLSLLSEVSDPEEAKRIKEKADEYISKYRLSLIHISEPTRPY